MKGSGIGGQAVMEGVMMKNGDKYAVAVRKPDGDIVVDTKDYNSISSKCRIFKWPIIRGVVAFIDSLILGVGTLTYSASFFEDEDAAKDSGKDAKPEKSEESGENKKEQPEKEQSKSDRLVMAGLVCLSVILAIGIFMLLPYFLSQLLKKVIESAFLLALIEGILRLVLFVGYVAAISLMGDIKRVYMYHGAEHKSINCIEHGLELTVDNVRGQSREHKRCGTSFLLFVMLMSVVFFMFIRVDNAWLRIVIRLLLIPVIAGLSYEFIKVAGRSDNKFVNFLSKPGLALQKLTTREPDDSMIEVAIASVDAVFDWRTFLENYNKDEAEILEERLDKIGESAQAASEGVVQAAEAAVGAALAANAVAEYMAGTLKNNNSETADFAAAEEALAAAEESVARAGAAVEEAEAVNASARDSLKKTAKEIKTGKVDYTKPTVIDEDEDDEILKALDQYFVLKQKKDN